MKYSKPKQSRALATEEALLEAFGALLGEQGYAATTVSEIGERANRSPGAFLARFGSKRQALDKLFERFCDEVYEALQRAQQELVAGAEVDLVLRALSECYEGLVRRHLGANRAMKEVFLTEGQIDPQTRSIFKATVALLHDIWVGEAGPDHARQGSFASTQVLVTLNYEYVLGSMPAFPSDPGERHRLIVRCMRAAATGAAIHSPA
jgi:AcrR family transcriptional regulator